MSFNQTRSSQSQQQNASIAQTNVTLPPPPPFGYGVIPPPMAAAMMVSQPPPVQTGMIPVSTQSTPHMTQIRTTTTPINSQTDSEKPPPTTVFVGNISERVPELMIRQMLQRCGTVLNWKRAQGANGKLQGFGFCEYENPEATLRCIRLLNEYEICEKKLVVKVDQKTKELLTEYMKKKRKANETKFPPLLSNASIKAENAKKAVAFVKKRKAEDGNNNNNDGNLQINNQNEDTNTNDNQQIKQEIPFNLDMIDENTLKEDRIIINAFETLLKQYSKELQTQIQPQLTNQQQQQQISDSPTITQKLNLTNENQQQQQHHHHHHHQQQQQQQQQTNGDTKSTSNSGVYMKQHLRLEEIKLDADKKDLITSEIQIFREKHKDENEKIKKETKERIERIAERERVLKEQQQQKRSRSRERYDSPRRRRSNSKTRSKSPSQSRINNSRYRYNGRNNDDRTQNIRDERRLSREERQSTSIQTSLPTNTNEDPDEANERRRLERKLREKELAYRERLKLWESREQKRSREYEIEKKKELHRRKQILKEAKKLKQFLEDYDDDKDDEHYYKGTNLAKRLKMREKEIEIDNRDRIREKEELDELKQKLLMKNSKSDIVDDIDAEVKKLQDDEYNKMRLKYENAGQSSDDSSSSDESIEQNNDDYDEYNEKENRNTNDNLEKHRNTNKNLSPQKFKNENYTDNRKNFNYNLLNLNRKNDSGSSSMDIETVNFNKSESIESLNQKYNLNDDEMTSNSSFNRNSNLSPDNLMDESSNQQQTQITDVDYMTQSPSQSSINQSPFINENSQQSNTPTTTQQTTFTLNKQQSTSVTIKRQIIKTKTTIQPKNQAFADDDDEQQTNAPNTKRAKLLQIEAEKKQQQQQQQQQINKTSNIVMNAEERKKIVKKLVESIPTDRDELFNFNIDWDQLDQQLMEKRIKPWVNRKIIEYIGEEEATLNDFICLKISQHVKPDKILDDVKVILDDEAELFVKKMWRLIVYETESKRLGLSK